MKLKQKLALSLCTFYLISVIGVALSMHFCGGKLASVSAYTDRAACKYCMAEAKDKKDDSCCKNTKVDVKVKDSHQAESSFKLPKLFSLVTFIPAKINELFKPFFPEFLNKMENKAPPRSTSVAIHIFNCVFRN